MEGGSGQAQQRGIGNYLWHGMRLSGSLPNTGAEEGVEKAGDSGRRVYQETTSRFLRA